ncbi:hypothetical protein GCM10011312_09260 [Planktosalinus lacus]|uniref:Uncharacterized protein n=1 Tax=Planktosalinus lacus TaxID=1526573 RepID=A0A8J2V9D2_9FLAO|nr:hypothetical protein GCM10011312_09260 [Planktosalinus lacus]
MGYQCIILEPNTCFNSAMRAYFRIKVVDGDVATRTNNKSRKLKKCFDPARLSDKKVYLCLYN